MIDNKYVQDYVRDQIDKHEAEFTNYGWKALILFVINELFLLTLIWLTWSNK
jgi:hypothetical protein